MDLKVDPQLVSWNGYVSSIPRVGDKVMLSLLPVDRGSSTVVRVEWYLRSNANMQVCVYVKLDKG